MRMATAGSTPARTMLRIAERRRSWNRTPESPGSLRGGRPRLAELADGLARAVEDKRAVRPARSDAALDDGTERPLHSDRAGLARLGILRGEGDRPRLAVERLPRELRDLAFSHAGPERPGGEVLKVGVGHEALPSAPASGHALCRPCPSRRVPSATWIS